MKCSENSILWFPHVSFVLNKTMIKTECMHNKDITQIKQSSIEFPALIQLLITATICLAFVINTTTMGSYCILDVFLEKCDYNLYIPKFV